MLYTVMTEGFMGHKPGEFVHLNASVGKVRKAVATGNIVLGQRRMVAPKVFGEKSAAPTAPPAPAPAKAPAPRKRAKKTAAPKKEK